MTALRLVRYRTPEHSGQHPRCPECRARVERLRKFAKPGLTGRPLAEDETPSYLAEAQAQQERLEREDGPAEIAFELCDGTVHGKYDPRTGEITDLSDWNGGNVSYRVERMAEDYVAERMAEGRHD